MNLWLVITYFICNKLMSSLFIPNLASKIRCSTISISQLGVGHQLSAAFNIFALYFLVSNSMHCTFIIITNFSALHCTSKKKCFISPVRWRFAGYLFRAKIFNNNTNRGGSWFRANFIITTHFINWTNRNPRKGSTYPSEIWFWPNTLKTSEKRWFVCGTVHPAPIPAQTYTFSHTSSHYAIAP